MKMATKMMTRKTPLRRGTILAIVIVVIAMCTLIAAGVMFRVRADITACAAGRRGGQAYCAAMSGVQTAISVIANSSDDFDAWYDNPSVFEAVPVTDDGANAWYFTVYANMPGNDVYPRFGLTDEASKINVNTADTDMLMALPNMTEELTDCLLDFIDSDDLPRANGAEQEYYDQLPVPYQIKNSPLVSAEEMLLVKGFTGKVVYGEDANMNGILDPNENDGDDSFPPDDRDGELNRGLAGLLTARSYEPDADNMGRRRIYINGKDSELKRLGRSGLGEQTIGFINMYRADGRTFTHPSQLLEMKYKLKKNQGSVPAGTTIESGVGSDELEIVMDRLTVIPSENDVPIIGLINVNTASEDVLFSLPPIDETLAQSIIEARGGLDGSERSSIAWLYSRGVVDSATFKAIAPRLTGRAFQFRIKSVGYGIPCGQFKIIEVVVDIADGSAKIKFLRDITRLGLPFSPEGGQER